ncbi:hypothetical protein Droror1_Dr00021720 [Drosera rotundifolia]
MPVYNFIKRPPSPNPTTAPKMLQQPSKSLQKLSLMSKAPCSRISVKIPKIKQFYVLFSNNCTAHNTSHCYSTSPNEATKNENVQHPRHLPTALTSKELRTP